VLTFCNCLQLPAHETEYNHLSVATLDFVEGTALSKSIYALGEESSGNLAASKRNRIGHGDSCRALVGQNHGPITAQLCEGRFQNV
jgi:hypothetical protein